MTSEDIATALEKDLLRGAFPPGSTLPQGALATRFGVSRIPVRDALAQLARAGLVDVTPNRRARVVQMSRADVVEAYDLRLLLECDLLARAIPVMTQDDLHHIDYALARSNLEARNANWSEGDALFHSALYAPARRPRHLSIIETLRCVCRLQIAAYDTLPANTDLWLADHAHLRDLCHHGDATKAVACLRSHLEGAREVLLDTLSTKKTG
ncbi:MAG: GntR family transcriptional regulator [Pseudomonadota bacterium]